MKNWEINKSQYNKLLSFIGTGDLPKADIIVFGNEEGVGGNPLYANIEARENYFGKNEGEDFYTYTLDLNRDHKNGFWNPSAIEGEKKVFTIMERDKHELPKKGNVSGGFLQYCARICLACEDNQNDISFWFEPKGKNKKASDKISEYIREGLFQPNMGIQTFLMDWRPLPRPNEGWWGSEYSKSIDKKSYLNAFNLRSSNKNFEDQFSNYSHDVEFRKNILKNAVLFSKAKVIIGLGNIDTKKNFIKEILSLSEYDFKDIKVEGTNVKALMCNVKLEEKQKQLTIFLLPFPLCGKGPFQDGIEMNTFYKEITKQIKECM